MTTSMARIAGDLTGSVVTAEGGSGPQLVFVHGMFAGAWMLEPWQRYAADRGFSSVAVNLRGHCGSRPVEDIGRVSIHDYVDDVLEVVRGLDRPIVIGHSMGGLIAQKVAESGAARALVLLCSAPPRGIVVASGRLFLRQLRHMPAVLGSRPVFPSRADADALIFNCVPAGERAALYASLVPDSGRAGRDILFGACAVDARRVRCPVLSVTAGEDRFLVPRIGRALARKYGAEHRHFAGHGHFVVGEPGWEEVADVVLTWLAGVGAA
ncbi:MAG: alpha/beta hydrolase [Gemmatimonadaceae bacterium]|nr:alpha/beta hydrolase [Gemmatimonadaceae bacterium]